MSRPPSTPVPRAPGLREDARLTPARKVVYGLGDFTVNTVLTSLSIVYVTYFLTQIAGLRPELAGLVQLVGRAIDAVTDPAMGRVSDLWRSRWGRRRPFFVIGALPLGLTYALLWSTPAEGQAQMFAYYTFLYVLLSLSLTVLSVPYLALLPEMALGYDARTSLNTYRNVGSVIGIGAAVALRPVAEALGGGHPGYALAGVAYGVGIALPWFLVFAGSWERPEFQNRESGMGLREGLRVLARHRTFRLLTGIYISSRIAMDLIAAMLILLFTYVLNQSRDFEITMALFLGAVMLSLPVWLRVALHFEKSTLFVVGAAWWICSFLVLLLAREDWPRWLLLAIAPFGAIGFAVVDLMAWSMLGEVVDEDDLATGERREGIYNGAFMFLRKLAGSIAVALALGLLGLAGFEKDREQSETVQLTIRLLSSLAPAAFLLLSIALAWRYPLSREAHGKIRARIEARDGTR